MASPVRIEPVPPILRLTLDRPTKKNALDLETVHALRRALADAAHDENVRVVVLQGAGGDFSAGGDAAQMLAYRGQGAVAYRAICDGLVALVQDVLHHPRPVIARVDGVCLGAGAALALACDALLATERARIGFPFVNMGLVPDTAAAWILPHVVGVQHARRLLLTGETLAATEADELGLVTQMVADEASLDATVDAWCERFRRIPATAIAATKRLLWQTVHLSLGDASFAESLAQGNRLNHPDHAAAVDAFLARGGKKA